MMSLHLSWGRCQWYDTRTGHHNSYPVNITEFTCLWYLHFGPAFMKLSALLQPFVECQIFLRACVTLPSFTALCYHYHWLWGRCWPSQNTCRVSRMNQVISIHQVALPFAVRSRVGLSARGSKLIFLPKDYVKTPVVWIYYTALAIKQTVFCKLISLRWLMIERRVICQKLPNFIYKKV